MVKVLQIVGGLRRAGTETWLLQSPGASTGPRWRWISSCTAKRKGEYEEELRDLGFGILRTPMPNRYAAYVAASAPRSSEAATMPSTRTCSTSAAVTTFLASRQEIPARSSTVISSQPDFSRGPEGTYAWVMLRLIRRHATHRIA
jgi:hypothetical protein